MLMTLHTSGLLFWIKMICLGIVCVIWRCVDEERSYGGIGVIYCLEITLGEHGGSGDVQGFDKEWKEMEWEKNV